MRTLGDFRKLTADLPNETRLLADAPDHHYRYIGCSITTAIAVDVGQSCIEWHPDWGNAPELYDFATVEEVQKRRRTIVVIE